jgi:peptide deformylase
METIRHEDIGVNLPARLGANLAQRLNEALAIRIVHENPLAPVTAIHDVINCTSILDSQLSGQARGVALAALYINIKN